MKSIWMWLLVGTAGLLSLQCENNPQTSSDANNGTDSDGTGSDSETGTDTDPGTAADTGEDTTAVDSSRIVAWDGENGTAGYGWVTANGVCSVEARTDVAHSGDTALAFTFVGENILSEADWVGAGWNWVTWRVGPYGIDTTAMKYFTFWLLVEGESTEMRFNLLCNGLPALDTPAHHTAKVIVADYDPAWNDGQWHQIVVPLADLIQPTGYDPAHVAEFQFFNTQDGNGTFYIDDLAFVDETGVTP